MNSLIASVVLGGLGLIVGSVLAMVSVRLPLEEDIVAAPSHCRGCGQRLRPRERVPVISWLVLKARCPRCGCRISPRYPLIELGAAALGVVGFGVL